MIAFVFQNYALMDEESVQENLEIVLDIQKKYTDKHSRVQEALTKVGLAGYEKKRVCTLSGGEQQRVALARVLLKPCDILLADEPTGNLDSRNKELVFQILKMLQEYGSTILMVTHDMELAGHCDEILQLGVTE